MRLLLDTNVILDVLLNRQPWVHDAARIWQAISDYRHTGYLTASAVTDIFYVVRRQAGLLVASQAVSVCLRSLEICTVDREVLEISARLRGNDFEDNLQIACAIRDGLDAVVTRDPSGFRHAGVLVLFPSDVPV